MCVRAKGNSLATSGCGVGNENPEDEGMVSVGQMALMVVWGMRLAQG